MAVVDGEEEEEDSDEYEDDDLSAKNASDIAGCESIELLLLILRLLWLLL